MLKSRLYLGLMALMFVLGIASATAWAGDRSSRSQKSCKSAKSSKSYKSAKSCKSDKSHKSAKSNKSGKSAKSCKSDKSYKSGKYLKSAKSQKSSKTDKSAKWTAPSSGQGVAPGKVLVCHVTQVFVLPMGVWHLARVIEVPEPTAAAMLAQGDRLAEPGLLVGHYCAWWE